MLVHLGSIDDAVEAFDRELTLTRRIRTVSARTAVEELARTDPNHPEE